MSDSPDVQPQRVYVRYVSFDTADGAAQWRDARAGEDSLRICFNLRNRSSRLATDLYEVVFELKLECLHDQTLVYRAEIHQAGIFAVEDAVEDQRRVLNTRCPQVLLPLAKQVADELVHGGGFPPFQLPPIDFDAVYAGQPQGGASPAPLLKLSQFWKAVNHLQAMGRSIPRPTDFRAMHAAALRVAQLSREALPAADQVLAGSPREPGILEILSAVYTMNHAHQRAVQVYRNVVSVQPGDARAHYNLATSLMFTGDLAGAEREIETCIDGNPTFWDAYTVLSQVSRHNRHVDRMLALLKQHGGQPQARERLNMALAMQYEAQGDYARAFLHLAEGNAVGKARRRYDIRRDEAVFDALMRYAPVAQPASAGCPTDEPIFVFGMPRSGTTLVERMLSSHPQVTSAGELKQFGMLLKCLSGSPTDDLIDADTVARARDLDWKALGEQYLASTRPLSGQAPHFIDKFPHHFLYAGHLANALPRAKIICLRRNPMDTCLGNFRQVFSETSPFHGYACDLLDTGRYYVMFDRLMAHWQRVFPGRILEVSYESLVEDGESGVRAMLAFCGLDWDPDCLAFETNRAPVATASAAQVRSPLYRHAVQRWRHYAEPLAPLREMLLHAGVDVPSS